MRARLGEQWSPMESWVARGVHGYPAVPWCEQGGKHPMELGWAARSSTSDRTSVGTGHLMEKRAPCGEKMFHGNRNPFGERTCIQIRIALGDRMFFRHGTSI